MTGVTRRLAVAGAVVAVALSPTAPVSAVGGQGPAAPQASTGDEGRYWLAAGGEFARHRPEEGRVPQAVTYDPAVPEGVGVTVSQRLHGDGMSVRLWVDGTEPGRTFGAHVHTEPCGAEPEDSGPHYQNRVDPVRPSVDPEYANPGNEVWLDLTADHTGVGRSFSHHDWTFRPGRARSVVLHEHATRTGEGRAGQAGARLACVNVPFGPAGSGAE